MAELERPGACCSEKARAECCDPAEKEDCCTEEGACGCAAGTPSVEERDGGE